MLLCGASVSRQSDSYSYGSSRSEDALQQLIYHGLPARNSHLIAGQRAIVPKFVKRPDRGFTYVDRQRRRR